LMFLRLKASDAAVNTATSVRADRARALVALQVRHQHRIGARRLSCDAGEHLGRIGQLRHPLRADEAGAPRSSAGRRRQAVDQRDLVGGGDGSRLSFCRPSRGPTSTMRTRGQSHRPRVGAARTHLPCRETRRRASFARSTGAVTRRAGCRRCVEPRP
jgi:hypothetical protein